MVDYQPNTHNRGLRRTTSLPSHYVCGPQPSLEGGNPVSHTLYDVCVVLDQGREKKTGKSETTKSIYDLDKTFTEQFFLTSEKVHGQTNQNQQFSALHGIPEEDSLALYHDESPSFHGNTVVHRISPPYTCDAKKGLHSFQNKIAKLWHKLLYDSGIDKSYRGCALVIKSSTSL